MSGPSNVMGLWTEKTKRVLDEGGFEAGDVSRKASRDERLKRKAD